MTEEVKKWGAAGAILVQVDYLDAAGNVEESHPERVVTDFLITPTKFAFLSMEQERPDAVQVVGFEPRSDAWVLESDGKRLTIMPLLDKKALLAAKMWKMTERSEAAVEELETLFNEM